jgi:hypothetical protein
MARIKSAPLSSWNPVLWLFGLLALLLLLLAFDVGRCATKYLYFTSEIGLFLVACVLYVECFRGMKWGDPPEKADLSPQPGWRKFSRELLLSFSLLAALLALVWVLRSGGEAGGFRAWLKSGFWYLYYLGIFGVSILLIRRHLQYVHRKALVTAAFIMAYFLATYEMLLLSRGTGWAYNHTVIGWLLGVPIDNLLFIYPVAPALTMVFYSVLTRTLNDLKAFWILNLVLIPASAVVELIGNYPLNLWKIFNDQSVFPMGKTNLEEFLYYILFQFLAILLYVYFARGFKRLQSRQE